MLSPFSKVRASCLVNSICSKYLALRKIYVKLHNPIEYNPYD